MFEHCHPEPTLPCDILHTVSWVLVGVGSFVFLVAFLVMVRAIVIWRKKTQHRSKGALIALVLKCTLPWAVFLRLVDMLISSIGNGYYVLLGLPWNEQSWGELFISSLPGYILVATYLLLVLFWAWLYSHSRLASHSLLVSDPLTVWLMCVAAEFVVYIVFLMLMAALPDSLDALHKGEATYAALLYVVIAALFVGCGGVLFLKVKSAATHSHRSELLARKIFWLTVICTVLFTARAVIVMLSTFAFTSGGWVDFGLTIAWTFGCEYLPALLMIIILHWSAESQRKASERDTEHAHQPKLLQSAPINHPLY